MRTWKFTDRLPDGNNIRYVLRDRSGSLRLDPEPSDFAIGTLTSSTPLKILKFFIEKLSTEFSRDEVINAVWPEKKDLKKTESDYKNLNSQLTNLRNHFRDHDVDEGGEESGRLLITVRRAKVLKFGGHDIVLPDEETAEPQMPSTSSAKCIPVDPLARLSHDAPSRADEQSHEPVEDRIPRQAARTINRLCDVRPLLGLNLPNVDFGRESHFVDRTVDYYDSDEKDSEHGILRMMNSAELLDRLTRESTHLGLMAAAGMGKSALLDHLTYLSAHRLAKDPSAQQVPIVIRLGDVKTPSDITAQIEQQLLVGRDGDLTPKDFRSCVFVAFIDGLDELPSDLPRQGVGSTIESTLLDLIGEGIAVAGGHVHAQSSLLSSRAEGVHLCNLLPHFRNSFAREAGVAPHVVSLLPLSQDDQARYIRQFFASSQATLRDKTRNRTTKSDAVVAELRDELSERLDANTPLLLFLLCYLHSHRPSPEIKLPATATQLLQAGIRRCLQERGPGLTDAHLIACSCLAFEHRVRGRLTADDAEVALVATCEQDLSEPGGLAGRLDIRRSRVNETSTVDHVRLRSLIQDILCARTGLLRFVDGYVQPVDARVADLLVAMHLRRLTIDFGFGFDRERVCEDTDAVPCIVDPKRARAKTETVVQAVSRWAWNSERWSGVIRDLAVLLAEDQNSASLITMLGEYRPIVDITPTGDDDAGTRLVLAKQSLTLAIAVGGEVGLDRLETWLHEQHSLRNEHSLRLMSARNDLTRPGRNPVLKPSESYRKRAHEFLKVWSGPTMENLLEHLGRTEGFETISRCLLEIQRLDCASEIIPGAVLCQLADAVGALTSIESRFEFPALIRLLHLAGVNVLRHGIFLDRLAGPHHTGDYQTRQHIISALLERALFDCLDTPSSLEALLGIQLDRARSLHSLVSEAFVGFQRFVHPGRWSDVRIEGRRVSSETIRLLTEYLECGLPGYCGTSAQNSAISLLTRVEPETGADCGFLSDALCRILCGRAISTAFIIIRALPRLDNYDLDFRAIYVSVLAFADRRGNDLSLPEIITAALTCLSKTSPHETETVLKLLGPVQRLPDTALMAVMRFGAGIVKQLGLLWEAIRLADTDPDYGHFGDLRRAGLQFLVANASILLADEEFLAGFTERLNKREYHYASDIVLTFLRFSQSAELAKPFLERVMKATSESFVGSLFEKHLQGTSLLDTDLRFRRSADSVAAWVETLPSLTAGHAFHSQTSDKHRSGRPA